jgi:hypothetical protein
MRSQAILALGAAAAAESALMPVVDEFGWRLLTASTLEDLASVAARNDVIAVLIEPAAVNLSWKQAISAVRAVLPKALPILCHRFSENVDGAEASASGAFHLLGIPFKNGELRQSLGFVWAATNKRFHVMPLPITPPSTPTAPARRGRSTAAGRGNAGSTEHVA